MAVLDPRTRARTATQRVRENTATTAFSETDLAAALA